MRHGKTVNHLGRTKSHRDALLANMAVSLIKAKRIETTLAKAKALRKFVEPLITKGKNDTTHSRRVVFSYLQDKEAIKELFGEIAVKVAERNGGYTRIIKLGQRQGDNAEVALIELVDFNENLLTAVSDESEAKAKRSRRGKAKKAEAAPAAPVAAAPVAEEPSAEVVEEAPVAEEAPATEEKPADESSEENKA
ncbi:MAG: 50S ribosomal protein L17 [Leadbetterella sp.]|nr:50S ribosomal protein L17 [Leadbetterella sp.]